ncbi:unnamed protein product, partial [Meganyctiphanes norvegica]
MVSYLTSLRACLHSTLLAGLSKIVILLPELSQTSNLTLLVHFRWILNRGHQYLQIVMDTSHQKSETDAVKFRNIGNDYYQKKDFPSALNNYNLSIMTAPHPKMSENNDAINCEAFNELSLGYGNRSAVLMQLKQYEKAICDIDIAIKVNGTKHMNYKLLERKVRCLIANNECKEANDILDALISDMECKGKDNPKPDENTRKNIYNLKKNCNQLHEPILEDDKTPKSDDMKSNSHINPSMSSEDLLFAYTNPATPELLHVHPTIPSFNKDLKLCYTPEKGRFVIAERDIRPGEVLGVEEACSYTLNTQDISKYKIFCYNCMKRCAAPLPCPQCNMIVFCSEPCRVEGWNKFHMNECQILPTILSLGFPASDNLMLALRIIMKTSYLDFKQLLYEIENRKILNSPLYNGFNKSGIYDSFNYESVYNLVRNVKERDPEYLIAICYWIFMVLKVLIESKQYYLDRAGTPFIPNNEDIVLVGSILLRHILSIYCNCFAVNETKINVLDGSIVTKKIGTGLFSAFSLFNHSCNPSVMNFTYGNVGVCLAIRFVPAGEEVCTKYGKMYCFEKDVEIRRAYLLRSYYFLCNCDPCMNNWQTDSSKPPELRPHEERIYRENDKTQNHENVSEENNAIISDRDLKLEDEMEDIFELDYDTAISLKNPNADLNEHIPTICKIIEFLERFAIKPDVVSVRAQISLVNCFRNQRPVFYFKRKI